MACAAQAHHGSPPDLEDRRVQPAVGGNAVPPPYWDALALGEWAWANRSLVWGRVTLAGGDAESLTLPEFLNAAYAILADEARKVTPSLADSLELVDKWNERSPGEGRRTARGSEQSEPKAAPAPAAELTEEEMVAQNNAALAALAAKMPGGMRF